LWRRLADDIRASSRAGFFDDVQAKIEDLGVACLIFVTGRLRPRHHLPPATSDSMAALRRK
jgi:hypothetical protein